ncbi:carbohydrate ABC transporter permease [Auraticoccus monumenti]|uniref:Multiple sugar transport system permease protein n=1 Tax=Auraticoccus monumenti TaxID=675864 RepID=A0A1G6VE98_9ACTN|nr:carbohydrate ABC transporter permease [Auraticoccus monumenti]SDD51723.1 multiple sugar transport system permease protein [Auraticoccus monumenti]
MTTTTAPAQPDSVRPGRSPRPWDARTQRPAGNRVLRGIIKHAVLLSFLAVMLYPVLWMVGASFRPGNQTFAGLSLFSDTYTVQNYVDGWSVGNLNFSRYFVNSAIITIGQILGNLFACSLTAYAFARLEFPFKRVLFGLVIATMLLPQHVTLIPKYIIFNQMGWVNTYLPLTVPHFFGVDAFFIFLMVQFIRTLPKSLDESARIDGCGHWGIFWRIIMPMSLPAIGTTAMFTFVWAWNDLLGPLLYLPGSDLWTVSLGLNAFLDQTGQSTYGTLFAMATLSLAPIVGFFIASQRLLVEGIATTGLK